MPVDETTLKSKEDAVKAQQRFHNAELNKLNILAGNIRSIMMIENPEFPNDDSKKIIPNDRNLGGKITSGRRQKIYDKILADSTDLGL